ncbi:MAG: ribosome maturation factor RimM [Bdellovibrionales bacterium]
MTKKIINKKNILKVGIVSRPHGLKGELFIKPLHLLPSWPRNISTVFIDQSEFEIESYKNHKQGFIFKLKNINHIDQSESLKGLEVSFPLECFFSKKNENIYLSELLKFQVEVLNQGVIGVVQSFESTELQDILLVSNGQKELKIPLVSDYIKNIDFIQKKILVDLPENFLEIFSD